MYEQFITHFKEKLPDFPESPDLELGLAVKQIRLRMGLTQDELAKDTRIKPAALKTFENGYARYTSLDNLESISRVLRVPLKEILLEGREWFPGNFFIQKLGESTAEGKRKRKRRDEVWYKLRTIPYQGFKVDIFSPPVSSPSHFCLMLLEIDPGQKIQNLRLPCPNQIAGFVARGTLRVSYESAERDVFGNQGFIFRGDKPHEFINLDTDNSLRLWLAFSLSPSRTLKKQTESSISVGKAIGAIREIYSDSRNRTMTYAELSYVTGLDEKSLQYLENTDQKDQVIYWDKIEKICQALRMPFDRFIDLAEGKNPGYFYLATAHDRALIDYRHYLGVRIKSTLFPSSLNEFHLSEMYIEPKAGIRRVNWKRTDNAMICVYVEDGELRIEVGKNRKATLRKGESAYFDGSLGYIFANPGLNPTKLLVATQPPIIF